jgi:hypothetical protein
MDKSHTKSGKMVSESQSKNRARNRGKKWGTHYYWHCF